MNAKELEARIMAMVENLKLSQTEQADQQKRIIHNMTMAQAQANAFNQSAGPHPANLQQAANLWAQGAQSKLGHNQMMGYPGQPPPPPSMGDVRTTEWEKSRILAGFRKHQPELAEFVDATAKLLGYDIGVALSPYDAVTFVARRKQPNFIWRVFSRKWQMDVQWIAGPGGGTQEAWLAHMGDLTDQIAVEKAALEADGKPMPPDLPDEPQAGVHNHALAAQIAQAQAYQNVGMHQAALGQAQGIALSMGMAGFLNTAGSGQ